MDDLCSYRGRLWLAAVGIALAMWTSGCDPSAPPADGSDRDARAQPNPNILPRPLSTQEVLAPRLDAGAAAHGEGDGGPRDGGPRDGGPRDGGAPDAALLPPEPLSPEAALPSDRPRFADLSGVTLKARWIWQRVPGPAAVPGVASGALEAAREEVALRWRIELSEAGRMRVAFDSPALPLPRGAELHGRVEHLGHVALWPDRTRYRIVPVGALRTTLSERRVDVTPLSASKPEDKGAGKRLGLLTRKVELRSALATLRLELAEAPEAGRGAVALCRALVEIAGVDPRTPACAPADLVLFAEIAWIDGGGIGFEVESLSRTAELVLTELLMPPPGARLVLRGLPEPSGDALLSRAQLAAFRDEAAPPPPRPADPLAPAEGVLAQNHSDLLLYLLLDGVAVTTVRPWKERHVVGPRPGRYSAQWRSFLGELITDARDVELPTRIGHGVRDAGAPESADAG